MPRAVAVIMLVVAVVCGMLGAGCAGDAEENRGPSSERVAPRHANVIPTQAQLVLDVDLRSSQLEEARSMLRRVPLWGIIDARVRSPEHIVASALSGLGLVDTSSRIAGDWVGPSGGLAVWRGGSGADVQMRDTTNVAWVTWVHTRSGTRAESALREQLTFTPLGTHRSVRMYAVAGPASEVSAGVFCARVHDSMVCASSRDALAASIDAAADVALETTAAYQRAMQPAVSGSEPLIRLWMRSDAAALVTSAARQGGVAGGLLANDTVRAWLTRSRDHALQLGVNQQGMWTALSYPATGARVDPAGAVERARTVLRDVGRSLGVQLPPTVARLVSTSARGERWAITIAPMALVDAALPDLDPRVAVVVRGQVSHVGTMRVSGSTTGSGDLQRQSVLVAVPLVE
jgi:hypothetical protein